MFSLKQAIVLALVGTAYAAPAAHRRQSPWSSAPQVGRLPTNYGGDEDSNTKVITVVTYGSPEDTSSDKNVQIVPYTGGGGRKHGGQQGGQQGGDNSQTTTPTDTDTDAPASSGSDTGYMATVNKYRVAGGLSPFTQSSKLEANAAKTARDGNGKMKHQLNPGTMGQVLAPGSPSDFEKVYVGGWLCEMPGLPGLNGICNKMKAGWDHSSGETGHAKILSNTSYKNIGCACEGGIWACDVS